MATLDPRRFTAAQYVDISDSPLRSQFRRMRSMQVPDPHRRQFGDQLATGDVPFPPATNGFLYFFSPPAQSPLAGGVRFRVVPQEPAPNRVGPAFAEGHDMLMAHGLPWQLPVWEIVTRRVYSCLRDVLVKDALAPGRLRLACNSLNITRDSVLVTALGMPWAVDWSTEFSRIYVVAPHHHPVAVMVRHPWYSRASERKSPYSGRGLVSLVRQPDGQFGVRVDKVLHLQQHSLVRKTAMPTEGQVTPFIPRAIVKSTKISEEKRERLLQTVMIPVSQLPWAPENPNPFNIYNYYRDGFQSSTGDTPERTTARQVQRAVPPHLSDSSPEPRRRSAF